MTIDPQTGALQLPGCTIVSASTTKASLAGNWEPWLYDQHDAVTGYRLVMSKLYQAQQGYLIIIFDSADQGHVRQWLLTIDSLIDKSQAKLEGKMTTRARAWFKEFSGIDLPLSASWGTVDAAYDPHNMSTYINCEYTRA